MCSARNDEEKEDTMKVFLVLLTIFLLVPIYPSLGQAKEDLKETDRTVITITLEERKELMPDTLSLNLLVSAKADKEAEVLNMLGGVDKSLRALKFDYSGGSYLVSKNCWWEKDRHKCVGYKGELNYLFRLKEAKEQNKILETVDEIKEKYGEKLSYSVSSPQWSISEKKIREAEEELKIKLIDSAKEFLKTVSNRLGRSCNISEINYDIRRPYFEQSIMLKAAPMREALSIEAPETKKEERTVSVRAQVRLFCIEPRR